MSFNSMRQIRISQDITRSPSLPFKNKHLLTPLKENQEPLKKSNSERTIKLPQILSPRKPTTILPEGKNQYQTNKASRFALTNKLDCLIGEIDSTLKVETFRTRQISDSIDTRIQKIDNHFNGKIKGSPSVELEKVMFSNSEKIKAVHLYNESQKSHYTSTASGLQYFKKNILHKEEQFGY